MAYANISQSDTYHNARMSATAWSALSIPQKEAALENASDALNIYAADKGGWRGDYRENTPHAIINACCEEALTLVDPVTQARLKAQVEGVSSTSIGSASESYSKSTGGYTGLPSHKAMAMLKPYVRRTGGMVPIV